MATFTYPADKTVASSTKPRVRKIQFGDGYQQRVADGINSKPKEWTLTFNTRTKDERDQIDTFLNARGGVEAFDWTPPDDAVSVKVVCESWTDQRVAAGVWNLSATFVQVFE